MLTESEHRIQPSDAILAAARRWFTPVRAALGHEFLAGYLTGSVLMQGFDPRHSRVNIVAIARTLDPDLIEKVAQAIPATRGAPHFEPMLLSRRQIEKSLDAFPIEWIEMQERHLLLEGEDVFSALQVPRTYLRLQLEHELRGKHIQMRQTLLTAAKKPAVLERVLHDAASSFAALFRTLLRLRGENPPADSARVVERVADLFALDATGLLVPHLVRYGARTTKRSEISVRFKRFLVELDRLILAIDELHVA